MSKSAKRKARSRTKAMRATLAAAGTHADSNRYANGRLKPPKPNSIVMDRRRELAGDNASITSASNPLDLALARGWITEAHHRTAMRLKAIYARTGLTISRMCGAIGETDGGDRAANDSDGGTYYATNVYSGMSDEDITALFDSAFNRSDPRVSAMPTLDPRAYDALSELGDQSAMEALAQWKRARAAMSADEKAETFDVCILDSWPQWLVQRCAGHFGTTWERKRDLLVSGLERAANALRKPQEPIAPVPAILVSKPAPRGPRRQETTDYVNAVGELQYVGVRITRRSA